MRTWYKSATMLMASRTQITTITIRRIIPHPSQHVTKNTHSFHRSSRDPGKEPYTQSPTALRQIQTTVIKRRPLFFRLRGLDAHAQNPTTPNFAKARTIYGRQRSFLHATNSSTRLTSKDGMDEGSCTADPRSSVARILGRREATSIL
jgi:hypothetical protein